MTPPPPESPQRPALERHSQTAARVGADLGAVDVGVDELGPSLTSAQLMATPFTDRNLPDLSVSNEALLASLRPAADNDLGTRVSRLARKQGERALYWFGTRPSWLQATLSVAGGSIVGLGLVVAYAKTFHSPPTEIAAEPVGPARGVALATAAAPAALIAQRVRPLSAAPAAKPAVAAELTVATEPAAAEPPAADTAAVDTTAAGVGSGAEADDSEPTTEPRKTGKRQRVSKSSSSSKLPSWVQQTVKPQAQRLAAREKKAALREKRAAALREKKARRARAKARAQE